MNYIDWNNKLAEYFFNEKAAYKNVFLYITKVDVTNIGKKEFPKLRDKSDEEVWTDFIQTVKNRYNLRQEKNDLLEELNDLFEYYNDRALHRKMGITFVFPIYISYLILFIIPLTEDDNLDINNNNYYTRVNTFLKRNNLKEIPNQNQNKNWNNIWGDLEKWTRLKEYRFGKFEIHHVDGNHFHYVAKPLSQCLLKITSIKKLPECFLKENMIPGQMLNDKKIINLLKNYQIPLMLSTTVINSINTNNDITKTLINIVRLQFENWTGEEDEEKTVALSSDSEKVWTNAAIKLVLEYNENSGMVNFGFRIFSKIIFPSDLKFNNNIDIKFEPNSGGWSKKFSLPGFSLSNVSEIKFTDNTQKWRATFRPREYYFFRQGKYYGLTQWLESDEFFESNGCKILCTQASYLALMNRINLKPEELIVNDIENISGTSFNLYNCRGGIPAALFCVVSRITIDMLGISFLNLIRLRYNEYLLDGKPKIAVDGEVENVEILTEDGGKKDCTRTQDGENLYKMPTRLPLNQKIRVFISGSENKLSPIKILASQINRSFYEDTPKFDNWGNSCKSDNVLWHGNKLLGEIEKNKDYDYSQHHFYSELGKPLPGTLNFRNIQSYNSGKDIMLQFLTSTGRVTFEKFFEVFDNICGNHLIQNQEESDNIAKYIALRNLEGLGHIIVDQNNRLIFTNKPQLILIPPVFKGRKAVLVGGRTPAMIDKLIRRARELNVKVDFSDSYSSRENEYILPQSIYLSAQGGSENQFGQANLKTLCLENGIEFYSDKLIQPLLLTTSAKITDYFIKLQPDIKPDYECAKYVFNPQTLFPEQTTNQYKTGTWLVKYKSKHETIFKLWIDGNSYTDGGNEQEGVDSDWAKYYILHKLNKNVILFDKAYKSVAVPLLTPLPKFINKALILMSGQIPELKQIGNMRYLVYQDQISILLNNQFTILGQNLINQNFMENL